MVHILNSISTEIKDTFFGLIKLINLLRTRKFLVQVISWSNNHKNNSILRGAMPFHIRNVKENAPEKSTLSIMLLQDLIYSILSFDVSLPLFQILSVWTQFDPIYHYKELLGLCLFCLL